LTIVKFTSGMLKKVRISENQRFSSEISHLLRKLELVS